jgi:hypothetical protein
MAVPQSTRTTALVLLVLSLALLLPGIFAPVLTVRGVLTKDGIAYVAPLMLDKGLNEETMKTLSSLINPAMISMMKALGGDLRQMIIDRLGPQLSTALQEGVGDIEVYQQTRSIIGSVRQLYDVGSPVPATLILLFSVIVPVTKAALVGWAMYMRHAAMRLRTLRFVEAIAKWSMADVFAVALFIVYLAAQATQQPPGAPEAAPPLLKFTADFGPGFYWFAAYCLFSLATQQYTVRLVRRDTSQPTM